MGTQNEIRCLGRKTRLDLARIGAPQERNVQAFEAHGRMITMVYKTATVPANQLTGLTETAGKAHATTERFHRMVTTKTLESGESNARRDYARMHSQRLPRTPSPGESDKQYQNKRNEQSNVLTSTAYSASDRSGRNAQHNLCNDIWPRLRMTGAPTKKALVCMK